MSYHHFTTFERGRIQELLCLGYSHRAIAKKLNRHHSSIDCEIRRNKQDTSYIGEIAQSSYNTRRRQSKPKEKQTDALIVTITKKLQATWSP